MSLAYTPFWKWDISTSAIDKKCLYTQLICIIWCNSIHIKPTITQLQDHSTPHKFLSVTIRSLPIYIYCRFSTIWFLYGLVARSGCIKLLIFPGQDVLQPWKPQQTFHEKNARGGPDAHTEQKTLLLKPTAQSRISSPLNTVTGFRTASVLHQHPSTWIFSLCAACFLHSSEKLFGPPFNDASLG